MQQLLSRLFFFLNINFRKIRSYSVASTTKAAFVIGGWDGSSALDIIAKFENAEWSIHGYLRQARKGHGSITFRTQTIVIGGGPNS